MAKPPIFVAAALGTAAELELTSAVQIWREAQETLTRAVEAERAARDAIVSKYFPNAEEGTHTGSMREHNLKCTIPVNRTVVQEQFAAAHAYAQGANSNMAEVLKSLLGTVFRAKQEVNVKEWKDLDAEHRKLLADIVTEKPGSPQLKLEPKK